MGSTSRGCRSWNADESGSRPWTSLMSKAELNISSSCQLLEDTFKDINRNSQPPDSGSGSPNPIRIIRRLTALEIVLGQLKQDCETISSKRDNAVRSVIANQNENMGHMNKILPMKDMGSAPEYKRDSIEDTNWNELSLEMKRQLDLLGTVASSH